MDITLSVRDQSSVRELFAVAPEPGPGLLPRRAVDAVARLIPCDAIGVGESDRHGYLLRSLDLPADYHDLLGRRVCDGPVRTGLRHGTGCGSGPWDPDAVSWVPADTLQLGRATPSGTVVQLYLDRRRGTFGPRELALLGLLEPVLARLMTTRPRLDGDEHLTGSELRVLELVASGSSNRDVADRLCISPATVSKHLEHCYRKLGVTSRTAAVAALSHAGA